MSIGGSIALLILGAIIAFGVEDRLPAINLFAIGIIIMLGGSINLTITLLSRHGRERRVLTEVERDGEVVTRRTEREVVGDDDLE